MRRCLMLGFAGIASVLILSSSALAHHGAASLYDVSKETTVKATVTEFVWTNPHVELGIVSVEDKSARWLLELGSPPNIADRGWTRTSLKPGDVVTVTFNPGTPRQADRETAEGDPTGRQGTTVVKAPYIVILTVGAVAAVVIGCTGGSASPESAPRPDISGTWRNPGGGGGVVLRPAQGEVPITPWAAERMKAARPTSSSDFRETTDPAVLYADPNGYPRITMHPLKFKFVESDDYVYQLWEYNQNWRQIALNGAHSPDAAPAWFGHAVGKWEGDTLVVDSRGYRESTWLDSQGLPHTEDLHIVERIRRDGDTLAIEITFDDPGAFTRPWSAHLKFERAPDASMTETIFTISDELRFRERFLGVPAPIPIRR